MNQRALKYRAGEITTADLAYVALRSHACHYCGIGLEIGQGSFDHSVPLDRGGPNHTANIVRCCYTCNREKFTKTPEELEKYHGVTVICALPGCGVKFKPRYAEWANGRARYHSRSCAAKSRFRRATA